MFIPIGLDQNEVRRTPWVTNAIIGLDVAVFVVMWAAGTDPGQLGYRPDSPTLVSILTSLVVHGGILHLFGNLVFFYLCGPFIEDAYGRLLFAGLYLSSGLVSAGVHILQNRGSDVPTIGASGAIAGIMGAFLVRYGARRIQFLWMPFFPFTWLARQFSVRAFLYLPFWFATQVLLAAVAPAGGVAVWAHIGGFVFGAAVALVIDASGFERRVLHPRIEAKIGFSGGEELTRAIEEGQSGRFDEALRRTERILAGDPSHVDARRYAYEIAREAGRHDAAGRHALRLLEAYRASAEDALARELADEIRSDSERAALPAALLLRAGEILARDGGRDHALAVYERLVSQHPADAAALKALLSVSDLRRSRGDAAGAAEALSAARAHPLCVGEWVDAVERRRAALAGRAQGGGPGYRGGVTPPRA
jgi:membrane associated rhomboid family serine protease